MVLENLSMLRGRDYKVCEGITIRQPTLSEIEQLEDENEYYSMISVFVCHPFDMIAQLDDMGIDFTKITSYQLFCVLVQMLEVKNTKILFGDLDFKEARIVNNNGKEEIHLKEGCIITEEIYEDIVDYIRKINMLSPPTFTKVADEYTKQKMIEYAHEDLEFSKRRKVKPKSILKTYISRATNHPYFKFNINDVWDMKLYAFYDAIASINIIENSHHLYMGAYSGNLDMSKINKSSFNWLRETQ